MGKLLSLVAFLALFAPWVGCAHQARSELEVPGRDASYLEPAGEVASVVHLDHVHQVGCGHYFWHGTWHDQPHPYRCSCGDSAPSWSFAPSWAGPAAGGRVWVSPWDRAMLWGPGPGTGWWGGSSWWSGRSRPGPSRPFYGTTQVYLGR